jgi:hypothetical protein
MRAQYQAALWCTTVVFVAHSIGAQHASGAELVEANGAHCEMKLQGEIEPGDFKKLAGQLTWQMRLCLNSPGGSYFDGLRLFEHIADNRIATVVDASDVCFSACAIAFMGGADGKYGDRFPNRTLHSSGQLGFHSPSLVRGGREQPPTDDELSLGVSMGILVVAKLIRSDKYNLLSKPLIAEMLETPPSYIYYIDTFKKARTEGITLVGLAEPEKITKRMLYQACINSDPWSDDSATPDDNAVRARELGAIGKGNNYRILFSGFGFQGMEQCAVDVVSNSGNAVEVYVQLGSGG